MLTLGLQDDGGCTMTSLVRNVFELPKCAASIKWLEEDKEAARGFIDKYGTALAEEGGRMGTYYALKKTAEQTLREATEELHRKFLNATDYVIGHQGEFAHHFGFPKGLWPRIRNSWFTRNRDIIAGRFDLSLTETGLKAYEYNADSASCLMECGYIQDRWSKFAGLGHVGSNVAEGVFQKLVDTWAAREVEGKLHLLCDSDQEEKYHTLYMKSAAEAAGIKCKVIVGLDSFKWTEDGMVQDADGEVIKTVWKTWSWQTAVVRES